MKVTLEENNDGLFLELDGEITKAVAMMTSAIVSLLKEGKQNVSDDEILEQYISAVESTFAIMKD